MAPRGTKRVATAPSTDLVSPKKQHLNSKVADIVATLQKAEHLNEHCREMLIAMTLGLDTPKADRHPAQTLGVAMIEETLQSAKAKFDEDVTSSLDDLSKIEASNTTLLTRKSDAEASLQEKQAAKVAAQAALDAAKQAVVTAEGGLKGAKDLQSQTTSSVARLGDEKTSLEAAFQEHLKTPMDEDKTLHHHVLQPFVNKLDLEESLKMALPSSCVKTKEQRGSFDDLVITELIKAWNKKIASLTKSIEDSTPLVAERQAAVGAAEALLEGNIGVERTATAELEAAKTAESEAQLELQKAKDGLAELEPKLKEATDKHAAFKAVLDEYVNGTLATFEGLRDKEASGEVAATAGA